MKIVSITKKNYFDTIFNKGDKHFSSGFITFFHPNLNDCNKERVLRGVIASKKVGGAVSRNRAKRVLRELSRTALVNKGLANGSYVFVAKHNILSCPFQKLAYDMDGVITKIHSDND